MNKKEKLRNIGHIVAGTIILLHAYERYEKQESPWFHLIAGILFMLVAIFHHPLSKKIRWIDGLFYFLESLVMFYTTYEYFHHGKKALSFTYLVAGIGFMVATVLMTRKKLRTPTAHHSS